MIQDEVLWFDVPVKHTSLVKIHDSQQGLSEVMSSQCFRKITYPRNFNTHLNIEEYTHFGCWNREVPPVYRGVLISEGWNRGVPLYTEVSMSQERFQSTLLGLSVKYFNNTCLIFQKVL